MSVVAAWWCQTAAVMAADRCMVFGGKEMMNPDDKVLVLSGADGNALLGIAGYMDYADWWRAQIDIMRGTTRSLSTSCLKLVEALARSFVEAMRARGDGRVDDDKWHLGFEGLLVCREGLFHLYGDGSMGRSPLGYGAIGTGAEVAMGALWSEQGAERAVLAAGAHARGCGFGSKEWSVTWVDKE